MPPGPRACPAPRRDGEPGGYGVAPAPAEEVGACPGLRALAGLLPHQHLQAGQCCPGCPGEGSCLCSRAARVSGAPGLRREKGPAPLVGTELGLEPAVMGL